MAGESPAQEVARRETELTAQLYDGIAAFPDCAKIAAFIRRFHAATQAEIAELDRRRRPSDRDYLVAKREAWARIIGPQTGGNLNPVTEACPGPDYQAAIALVPSLDFRSYCKPLIQPQVEPRPLAEPSMVRHEILKTRLVQGGAGILPDGTDAAAMAIEEVGVFAAVKICLDRDGSVSEATTLKTSCFDDYDAKLLAGVRSWRYRPFLVNGVSTPVCTSVTFIYRPR